MRINYIFRACVKSSTRANSAWLSLGPCLLFWMWALKLHFTSWILTYSVKRLIGLPLANQPNWSDGWLKNQRWPGNRQWYFFCNISAIDWFGNDDFRANDFLRRLAKAQRTGQALEWGYKRITDRRASVLNLCCNCVQVVGPAGLEPATKGLWVPCSNQLRPIDQARSSFVSSK